MLRLNTFSNWNEVKTELWKLKKVRFYVFFRNNSFFLDDETIFVNNEPAENSFNEPDLNSVESELNEEFQEVKHSKTRRLVRKI